MWVFAGFRGTERHCPLEGAVTEKWWGPKPDFGEHRKGKLTGRTSNSRREKN